MLYIILALRPDGKPPSICSQVFNTIMAMNMSKTSPNL